MHPSSTVSPASGTGTRSAPSHAGEKVSVSAAWWLTFVTGTWLSQKRTGRKDRDAHCPVVLNGPPAREPPLRPAVLWNLRRVGRELHPGPQQPLPNVRLGGTVPALSR